MELAREPDSVVLRYRHLIDTIDPDDLDRASLNEGARIVALGTHHGVHIDLLDLSSLSTTGTFKDWVACLAVASVLRDGNDVVVTQSSGNTANSIARYAANVGLRALILYPSRSREKVQVDLAELSGIRFLEVAASERAIKEKLAEFAGDTGVPAIPLWEHQIQGNKLRAYLLRDLAIELGYSWDWHAQALSSAYGIFGLYQGYEEMTGDPTVVVPQVLGVQQQGVSPYHHAITGEPQQPEVEMLEPTLFRRAPTDDMLDHFRKICDNHGGTVTRVTNDRYLRSEPALLQQLERVGLTLNRHPLSAKPSERAGLYALAGTIQAIEDHTISEGERVLVAFTGGTRPVRQGHYSPALVAERDEVVPIMKRVLNTLR